MKTWRWKRRWLVIVAFRGDFGIILKSFLGIQSCFSLPQLPFVLKAVVLVGDTGELGSGETGGIKIVTAMYLRYSWIVIENWTQRDAIYILSALVDGQQSIE